MKIEDVLKLPKCPKTQRLSSKVRKPKSQGVQNPEVQKSRGTQAQPKSPESLKTQSRPMRAQKLKNLEAHISYRKLHQSEIPNALSGPSGTMKSQICIKGRRRLGKTASCVLQEYRIGPCLEWDFLNKL